jgi:hypothetical protein
MVAVQVAGFIVASLTWKIYEYLVENHLTDLTFSQKAWMFISLLVITNVLMLPMVLLVRQVNVLLSQHQDDSH